MEPTTVKYIRPFMFHKLMKYGNQLANDTNWAQDDMRTTIPNVDNKENTKSPSRVQKWTCTNGWGIRMRRLLCGCPSQLLCCSRTKKIAIAVRVYKRKAWQQKLVIDNMCPNMANGSENGFKTKRRQGTKNLINTFNYTNPGNTTNTCNLLWKNKLETTTKHKQRSITTKERRNQQHHGIKKKPLRNDQPLAY